MKESLSAEEKLAIAAKALRVARERIVYLDKTLEISKSYFTLSVIDEALARIGADKETG
jgi:hypothetical protein